MRPYNKKKSRSSLWIAISRYLVFFFLMGFVISCSMILFLTMMQREMSISLSEENINYAAKMTFANVIFLTIICTVIDGIRRKYMVERPIRRIEEAAEKIMKGQFTARIEPMNGYGDFGEVIACFNTMAAELSGVETLRTDFISNVSHELKTPLAVIQNYGKMLSEPGLSEEKRLEYANAVTDASKRLANLISNILKLNKLENQQIYPQKHSYNLGEQLCGCLLEFESIWENKNIEIDTEIEDDVFVESDPELLTLVWSNLFSNAFKFTDEGGKVSVKLKSEESHVVVEVSDTGCGISRETGAHIFEKFYQGDTSHAVQGNGLGLALVKRIVDIVGGDISVNSIVGSGSTFSVKIRRKDNGAF